MKKLLIIWDSVTHGSRALAMAAFEGAAQENDTLTQCHYCGEVTAEMMRNADAYLFCFPENLAAISGMMKTFFDRSYYPCLGQIEGRSFAVIVCAGSDGSNAVRQVERIAAGWRLKKIAESQIICTHAQTTEAILAEKIIAPKDLKSARDLGMAMAQGLAMGVF
jgi:multimeric flavodoxin WrbA